MMCAVSHNGTATVGYFSPTLPPPCGDPKVRTDGHLMWFKGLSAGLVPFPVFPALCRVLSLESKGEFRFARTVGVEGLTVVGG